VELAGENPEDYQILVDGVPVDVEIQDDGTFVVPGLPSGDHAIDVVRKDGLRAGRVPVKVEPGDPIKLPEPIKLEGAGQIVGIVVKRTSAGEEPLAGVEVVARSDLIWIQAGDKVTLAPAQSNSTEPLIYPPPEGAMYSAFTEEDGSYCMKGVKPGGYFVAVVVPGLTPGEAYVWVEANRTAVADFVLREAVEEGVGTVEGTVMGETEGQSPEPLYGAAVTVTPVNYGYRPGPTPEPLPIVGAAQASIPGTGHVMPPDIRWYEFRTLTDKQGHYSLNVPSGDASMFVWGDGYEGEGREIQVLPDQTTVQDFILKHLELVMESRNRGSR
jgi:hypothetical protein